MKNKLVYLVMVHKEDDVKIPPFALMLLSNVLKKSSFNVKVVHCPEDDVERQAQIIAGQNPLFVGFSVLTGLPTSYSAHMSRLIKKYNSKTGKNIPVVWGGVHPSLLTEQCIGEEYIDYVVHGEGEIALAELAKCILKGKKPKDVASVAYKDGKKTVINAKSHLLKNLDDYGYDFECVDLKKYIHEMDYIFKGKKIRLKTLGYYGSRGCPHNCAFCYNLVYNQRRWRPHSANKVVKDIEYLKRKYDVQCIDFWDDNFFVDKKRALQILEAIKCYSKIEVRIDYIDDKLAKKLSELGVLYMLIGGESGSDRILKLMNKGFSKKQLAQGARILNKYGLTAQYSFILGVPSETKDELDNTISMMYKISRVHRNSSFTVGLYLPYPGTDFYNEALKRGFKPPGNTEGWNVIDRWRNTVNLPWINNKICLNIRHLFSMLCWKNPLIKLWAAFRIRHRIVKMDLDIRIITRANSELQKIKQKIT